MGFWQRSPQQGSTSLNLFRRVNLKNECVVCWVFSFFRKKYCLLQQSWLKCVSTSTKIKFCCCVHLRTLDLLPLTFPQWHRGRFYHWALNQWNNFQNSVPEINSKSLLSHSKSVDLNKKAKTSLKQNKTKSIQKQTKSKTNPAPPPKKKPQKDNPNLPNQKTRNILASFSNNFSSPLWKWWTISNSFQHGNLSVGFCP